MFSIWSTVVMICRRKATSEISRLFLAMRMKRVLGRNPKPCNRFCVKRNWKLEPNCGVSRLVGLLVVRWVLLKAPVSAPPHSKPWV